MPTQFPNGKAPLVVEGLTRLRPRGPGRFYSRGTIAALIIYGITRDSGGNPLGGCTVKLFDTLTSALVATTTSDANGNYVFAVYDARQYYVVAYLAGTPDVAGTTTNTLVGSYGGS